MKVSIVLPVYNVAPYVEECVRSIVTQTTRDYELIVVDDCGTDDSMERIHAVLDDESSLTVHYMRHERNRGLSAARNTGLAAASGRYVLYVDSDDVLRPDCVATLVEAAERTSADVTVGNIEFMGQNLWVNRIEDEAEVTLAGQPDVLHAYLNGRYYVMAWNKLCRRDYLMRCGLTFEEGLVHEDNPWSLRMACTAGRVTLVPRATYIYRVREGSLQTSREFTPHYEAYCRILQLVADAACGTSAYDVANDATFRIWFERLKALYFHMTLVDGTRQQQRHLYELIRRLLPAPAATKAQLHYSLPAPVGYPLYRRMHGNLLM